MSEQMYINFTTDNLEKYKLKEKEESIQIFITDSSYETIAEQNNGLLGLFETINSNVIVRLYINENNYSDDHHPVLDNLRKFLGNHSTNCSIIILNNIMVKSRFLIPDDKKELEFYYPDFN